MLLINVYVKNSYFENSIYSFIGKTALIQSSTGMVVKQALWEENIWFFSSRVSATTGLQDISQALRTLQKTTSLCGCKSTCSFYLTFKSFLMQLCVDWLHDKWCKKVSIFTYINVSVFKKFWSPLRLKQVYSGRKPLRILIVRII